jgi:hypothetical protein
MESLKHLLKQKLVSSFWQFQIVEKEFLIQLTIQRNLYLRLNQSIKTSSYNFIPYLDNFSI